MKKRILTLDDLVLFCKSHNLKSFSSSKTGYKLSVQTPAYFEENDDIHDTDDDTLFYGTVKAFHTEENVNGSYVPKESAIKAMQTMKYKPILAYIYNFGTDENEDYDFTSHEIKEINDGDYEYIESQVGCFTADKPYMEYDEEYNRDFVYARAAIPKRYTKTVDIIKEKGGTKVSVELAINQMTWDGDNNRLTLDDFVVEGCTLLGRSIDDYDFGSQVGEGMQGARFIEDFKEDNNSITKFSEKENGKLIESLERLIDTLSNLSINNSERKEDSPMRVVENEQNEETVIQNENTEAFENESVENVNDNINSNDSNIDSNTENQNAEFDTEDSPNNSDSMSDNNDATSISENETFEDEDEDENEEGSNRDENVEGETSGSDSVAETDESFSDDVDNNECDNQNNEQNGEKKFEIKFELSHDDILMGLYDLIYATYQEEDLWITQVYDDYFIMEDYWNYKYYKQSYDRDGDSLSLKDERVEVFAEYITEAERNALDLMRSTYESMESELAQYKLADARNEKNEKVVSCTDYAEIANTDDFKNLVKDMDNYSVDEMIEKADLILAKHFKAIKKFSYTSNNDDKSKSVNYVCFASNLDDEQKIKSPYGGIFDDYFKKHKK